MLGGGEGEGGGAAHRDRAPRRLSQDGNVLHEQAESRKRELLEISKRPNLYEQLAAALAPSVWELDDVKKGVLLQLFGASNKQLDAEAARNARKRGEMNVLLVGDRYLEVAAPAVCAQGGAARHLRRARARRPSGSRT